MILRNIFTERRALWRHAHEELDLVMGRHYGVYHDDAAVKLANVRGILQMFLVGIDTADHVTRMLRLCDFPHGAHILDCGCGTGEMDTLIQQQRPDLRLTLLNKSMAQLEYCCSTARLCGDMHSLPFADASFDAMFLCYVLGYGAIDTVMSEAARVVKPRGKLVVADMVCQAGQAEAILLLFGYKCYAYDRLIDSASLHGLSVATEMKADILHPDIMPLFSEADREMLFKGIVPIITIFQEGDYAIKS